MPPEHLLLHVHELSKYTEGLYLVMKAYVYFCPTLKFYYFQILNNY